MSVWLFSVCWNEARVAPFWLRHYSPWVDRMVVWCERSNDGTEDILRANPKVDLREWKGKGLDDEKFMVAVNQWTLEARGRADWIAFVDMDELLYHPDMARVLREADGQIFPSTGYALISPEGWPKDDGHSQIYDLVKTGVPQPNYNKMLLYKPGISIEHTIGRHTYPGRWPKHRSKVCTDVGIKLLHLHYLGGVKESAKRNQRNLDRVLKREYAWNFFEENNRPEQIGSAAWVQRVIENNELEVVC